MAKRELKELLESVKAIIGDDNTSKEAIALYEDLSDSYNTDSDELQRQLTALQTKYDNLDKEWSTRYRNRFFSENDTVLSPDGNEINGEENYENEEEKTEVEKLMNELKI